MAQQDVYVDGYPSVDALRKILLANIVTTTIHYPHNYLKAEDYPPIWLLFPNALAFQLGIIIFWPLLSILGWMGYVRYKSATREGIKSSLPLLGAYTILGMSSIGHFLGGVPQIHWFFFTIMFTDFIAGSVLLWFVWRAKKVLDRDRLPYQYSNVQ